MMKKMPQWLKVLGTIVLIILLLIGGIGGYRYMEYRKKVALYQHGFRLLEEQIAVYLKDNYSGIKKVEFTDIYEYEDSGVYVQPIITDQHGHREKLDDSVNGEFGTTNGFYALEYDESNHEEIIELNGICQEKEIDVSNEKTLPARAKLSNCSLIDESITELTEKGMVKGIKKSKEGSPKLQIIYNLDYKGVVDK